MLEAGRGTLLFTGATAAIRGGPKFAVLACPKFALRALSQSIAREFQPKVSSTVEPASGHMVSTRRSDNRFFIGYMQ